MPWVRLDDNFPDHRKIAELGDYAPVAGWLFICGLAYCNRQLTDGFIPKQHVIRLASFRHLSIETAGVKGLVSMGEDIEADTLAELLEAVGLWEDRDTHWYIHDYSDYQPTKAEVEAEREQKRAAGRAGGLASGRARAKAGASAGGQADTQAKTKPVPVPVPTASNEAAVATAADFDVELSEKEEQVGRLIRSWENATATTVTRTLGDNLADWLERLPEAAIVKAIAETGASNARNWRYCEAILRRYETEGWADKPKGRVITFDDERVITFDDDLPLPEGMAFPEVRFQR